MLNEIVRYLMRRIEKTKASIKLGAVDELADDVDVPAALTALFDLVRVARAMGPNAGHAAAALEILVDADSVVGTLGTARAIAVSTRALQQRPEVGLADAVAQLPAPDAVEDLLALRHRARQVRDWDTADRVRDALSASGVQVQDLAEGVRYRVPKPQ